jgi:hypothetical protein
MLKLSPPLFQTGGICFWPSGSGTNVSTRIRNRYFPLTTVNLQLRNIFQVDQFQNTITAPGYGTDISDREPPSQCFFQGYTPPVQLQQSEFADPVDFIRIRVGFIRIRVGFVRIRSVLFGSGRFCTDPVGFVRIRSVLSGSGRFCTDPVGFVRIRSVLFGSGRVLFGSGRVLFGYGL